MSQGKFTTGFLQCFPTSWENVRREFRPFGGTRCQTTAQPNLKGLTIFCISVEPQHWHLARKTKIGRTKRIEEPEMCWIYWGLSPVDLFSNPFGGLLFFCFPTISSHLPYITFPPYPLFPLSFHMFPPSLKESLSLRIFFPILLFRPKITLCFLSYFLILFSYPIFLSYCLSLFSLSSLFPYPPIFSHQITAHLWQFCPCTSDHPNSRSRRVHHVTS